MLDVRDLGVDRGRPHLEQVAPAQVSGLLVHPDQVDLELVRDLARRVAGDDDVAPRRVDLAVECDRDRLSGLGVVEVLVEQDDVLDRSSLAGQTRTS